MGNGTAERDFEDCGFGPGFRHVTLLKIKAVKREGQPAVLIISDAPQPPPAADRVLLPMTQLQREIAQHLAECSANGRVDAALMEAAHVGLNADLGGQKAGVGGLRAVLSWAAARGGNQWHSLRHGSSHIM